jgi:outer membrane protein OmpA-like peptidoglycan-associated protein
MSVKRTCLAALALSTVLAFPATAGAQQKTFHLDRLEMPGAPDDGVVLFRPETQQRNIFFGQLGIGYSLRPLRTRNITREPSVLGRSRTSVIQDQLAVYGTAGFEVLDRAIFSVSFPWYPVQTGGNPDYGTGTITSVGQTKTTLVSTGGPAAGDVRLDFRFTLLRSESRRSALGAQLSVFAPSGTSANFGGDHGTGTMVMVTGEHTWKFLTFVANTGIHFRPRHAINDPPGGSGLGISDEWRWAVGAFVPLKDGKYRIGGTIFGQTGLTTGDVIAGKTLFTARNTPIEFNVEGRMRFGPTDHWWVGAGAGSAIARGYGAPDLRVVGLVGTYIPILGSDANSPEGRAALRARRRHEHLSDRDHDGVPDDIDACPDEPEDHLGNDPNDGCPMPPDRDHDGIPDQYDKCPDQPEDKDNIDDGDGCPEDDADTDGIPDAVDACPKLPGQKSSDPKRNGCPSTYTVEGNVVHVMQQVHFAFGSATILPESFPMLQEITNLLKANPGIKKMAIEGHTDNRGAADLNKRLSQARANSVMKWLVQHGVEQSRLEAHGYGMEQPIEDNSTDEGRAKNRRVEFKIVEEVDSNKVQKK